MGILMDLGVSSAQLDRPERGFSYRFDAPLDMRMDAKQSLTATEVVNGYEESQLAAVISQYGEERFARRIAHAIVAARPLRTTRELAEIVRDAIPAATRRQGPHPARRTFQAIRMEVNRELPNLADGLDESVHVIGPGGRVLVLAYHSLEDRMVKETLRSLGRRRRRARRPGQAAGAAAPAATAGARADPQAAASVGRRDRREPAGRERAPARGRAPADVPDIDSAVPDIVA